MTKTEFIAYFDAYIKNHCEKYDVQPIDPVLYQYILGNLEIAWERGDMEGFERCASLYRPNLETSEYKCRRCEDTGKLARHGNKAKGELQIVTSFCSCEVGVKMSKHKD